MGNYAKSEEKGHCDIVYLFNEILFERIQAIHCSEILPQEKL